MKKHNTAKISVVAAAATIATVLFLYPAASSTPSPEDAVPVPYDVVAGMEALGVVLEAAPADALKTAQVTSADAVAIAQSFGAGNVEPASVTLARYTDNVSQAIDVETGDPHGPMLGMTNRLVFVVIFDGLELRPFGAYLSGGENREAEAPVHHELVVLIDADTGEFISSTTFR